MNMSTPPNIDKETSDSPDEFEFTSVSQTKTILPENPDELSNKSQIVFRDNPGAKETKRMHDDILL